MVVLMVHLSSFALGLGLGRHLGSGKGLEHAKHDDAIVGLEAGLDDAHRPVEHADLDAPVDVARHKIGTSEEDLVIASIPEVVHAAVLQESTDNAGHADALAQARDAGAQTADSSND